MYKQAGIVCKVILFRSEKFEQEDYELCACGLYAALVYRGRQLLGSCNHSSDRQLRFADESVAASYGLMDTCQEGVILHAWQWSFNNIKDNMAKIAEAGYTSVQTSVIQQAKEGTKGKGNNVWWLYYQPANFTIDNTGNSALGTKAEFAAMCQEAHKYGIHVIVDVVANHLGNNTKYDKSPAIPSDIRDDANCWHDQWNKEINYGSRYSITHGSMGGLPDLNTENSKIQTYVKNLPQRMYRLRRRRFPF